MYISVLYSKFYTCTDSAELDFVVDIPVESKSSDDFSPPPSKINYVY